jgi:hypothetical protein
VGANDHPTLAKHIPQVGLQGKALVSCFQEKYEKIER